MLISQGSINLLLKGIMMKNKKSMILQALIMFTIACGGSGGGGSADVPHYSGAWSGGVSLISNSCSRVIPDQFQYLYFLHNVNQAENEDAQGNKSIEIVLDDGIDTYTGLGELDENSQGHRFSVTGNPHPLADFISGYQCIEILDFDYSALDFSTDTAGFVARHSSITCTKGNEVKTCDVTYTGSAYRTANPSAEPGNTNTGNYQ